MQELLGPQAWRAASAEAGKLGLDLSSLAPFEPWYAALAVTQLRLAQLGFDQSLGIEAKLSTEARKQGKEIRGLETLESQLGTLDNLSSEAQRNFLQTTLEEAREAGEVADEMIAATAIARVLAERGYPIHAEGKQIRRHRRGCTS